MRDRRIRNRLVVVAQVAAEDLHAPVIVRHRARRAARRWSSAPGRRSLDRRRARAAVRLVDRVGADEAANRAQRVAVLTEGVNLVLGTPTSCALLRLVVPK